MPLNISLRLYPFNILIKTNCDSFLSQLCEVYPQEKIRVNDPQPTFHDFISTFNRAQFHSFDTYAFKLGGQHFRNTSKKNMLPVFEWGFNWLISSFSCRFLCIHAAVVEKDNITLILPAPPGSGKSTMCALLMLSGWRLLSDEHCLLDLDTLDIIPFVRPVSLKNNSIRAIQQQHPDVRASQIFDDTLKGRMQYLLPTDLSWESAEKPAKGRYVIFPKYKLGANITVVPVSEAQLFERLLENSFNYTVLGERSFNAIVDWLPHLKAFDFTYSNNNEMLDWVESLS